MAHQSDGTSTVMLFRDFADYDDRKYRQWHQHIVAMAQRHEGLVDVNLHEPIPGVQAQWIQVITYDSIDHLKALLESPEYKAALKESEESFGVPVYQQVVANAKTTPVPVTVVISQVLKPGCEQAYQKWQLEMDAAARKFSGFQGTELIKPVAGIQNEWVVVFRFDSAQHLDDWFESDVHDELMKKAEPYFADVTVRRVGRGFEDWFTSVSGETTSVQAQVKMGMVVLLVLYPLVMLLTLFVTPNVSFWGFAFAMFISNAISVSLLTWPIMPAVSRWLGFWMQEDPSVKTWTTIWGGALIVVLYALTVAIFSLLAD